MKIINLLLVVLILSGFLQAQDAGKFNFTFNHLALSVEDVDRSAEFYKNVLNLQEINNRTKIEGIRDVYKRQRLLFDFRIYEKPG